MHPEMRAIRCSIMRGGTSKGIFLMENDLPKEKEKRDAMICAIFGSPDIRQIDGLGGADVLTSKVAIIGPSTVPEADVDYTFGQVSFEKRLVDYKGNCGNISAAVGPFAIDAGLVPVVEPITKVRIHLTNSDQILIAEVPVEKRKAKVRGNCQIDGVPGTGARIDLDWSNVVGTISGKLLPTGNPKDIIEVKGKSYEVSLVDAGNPLVFIKAESLGLTGTEQPDEIEKNEELLKLIEKIRGKAAVLLNLIEDPQESASQSPYAPFFAIVGQAADYLCYNGMRIKRAEIDLVSRLLFMQHMHKTYPITGTVCTGAAARIPGTIPWEIISQEARNRERLSIGHPGGKVEVIATALTTQKDVQMQTIKVYRTARKILDGVVYIRDNYFEV